jgi:WD40 repeat protein
MEPGSALKWREAALALLLALFLAPVPGALALEIEPVPQTGHGADVQAVAFSPDGELAASASRDGTVLLWTREGHILRRMSGHKGGFNSVAFSSDGLLLVTASSDGSVRTWSLYGEPKGVFEGHSQAATCAVFSPDGGAIASASQDNTARLWIPGSPAKVLSGHEAAVLSLAFSPDGQTLATCGKDGNVRLWSPAGEFKTALKGPGAEAKCVAFSADGEKAVAGFADGFLRVYDLAGNALGAFPSEGRSVTALAPCPDGKHVAAGCMDGTWRIFGMDGARKGVFKGHSAPVTGIAVSPDGKRVITGSEDNTVRFWKAGVPAPSRAAAPVPVQAVSWAGDGQAVTTLSGNGTLVEWNLNGPLNAAAKGLSGPPMPAAMAPEADFAAAGTMGGELVLFKPESPSPQTLRAHKRPVSAVAVSPRGDKIATAGKDKLVCLFSREGRPLGTLGPAREWAGALAFSPSGRQLAAGARDGGIFLYTLAGEGATVAFPPNNSETRALAFSPQGGIIAQACQNGETRLFSILGASLGVLPGQGAAATGLAFSKNGSLLATTFADGTAVVREMPSKRVRATFRRAGGAACAAFSSEGDRLALGGKNGTTQIFDVNNGELLVTLVSGPGGQQAAFAPDLAFLAAPESPGLLRFTRGIISLGAGELKRKNTPGALSALLKTRSAAKGPAPGLSFDNSGGPAKQKDGKLIFRVTVSDDRPRAVVYVNRDGAQVRRLKQSGGTYLAEITVPLDYGANLVEMIAQDADFFVSAPLVFSALRSVEKPALLPPSALPPPPSRKKAEETEKLEEKEEDAAQKMEEEALVPAAAPETPGIPGLEDTPPVAAEEKPPGTVDPVLEEIPPPARPAPVGESPDTRPAPPPDPEALKPLVPVAPVQWELAGTTPALPQPAKETARALPAGEDSAGGAANQEEAASPFVQPFHADAPTLHILSIGIGRHADKRDNLQTAEKDARAFASAMERQAGKMYGQINSVSKGALADPTFKDLYALLDTIYPKDFRENDTLAVYITGRAARVGKEPCLATAGASLARLDKTGADERIVPFSLLLDALAPLPCKKIMFLDVVWPKGSRKRIDEGLCEDMARAAGKAGVFAIGSTKEGQTSRALPGRKSGVFAKILIDGLDSLQADLSGDGKVTVEELKDYLARRLPEATGGAQTPVFGPLKNFHHLRGETFVRY